MPGAGGGGGGSTTTTPATTAGKYQNAEYNPRTKSWSVFDGTTWTSGIKTGDLYSQLSADAQKQHPEWWFGDQADQADYYLQRQNTYDAQLAGQFGNMGNTGYKYTQFGW